MRAVLKAQINKTDRNDRDALRFKLRASACCHVCLEASSAWATANFLMKSLAEGSSSSGLPPIVGLCCDNYCRPGTSICKVIIAVFPNANIDISSRCVSPSPVVTDP